MSIRICPRCRHTHSSSDVVRLNRFDQGKAIAYLARPIGKTFPTREAAWDAICTFWQEKK